MSTSLCLQNQWYPLCGCGCKQRVRLPQNLFCFNHQLRTPKYKVVRNTKLTEPVICKICGKGWDHYSSFGNHLYRTHNIKIRQYFEMFLRMSEQQGRCVTCGKPTKFLGLVAGYSKTCSRKCFQNSEEHKERCRREGRVGTMLGKKHTDRARQKMSEKLTGRKSAMKGKHHTLEARAKISAAQTDLNFEKSKITNGHIARRGLLEIKVIGELQKHCRFAIDTRHRPVKRTVLDGYIHELKLAIEFDEPYHDVPGQQLLDKEREDRIYAGVPGIFLWRIKQKEFMEDSKDTLEEFLWLVDMRAEEFAR